MYSLSLSLSVSFSFSARLLCLWFSVHAGSPTRYAIHSASPRYSRPAQDETTTALLLSLRGDNTKRGLQIQQTPSMPASYKYTTGLLHQGQIPRLFVLGRHHGGGEHCAVSVVLSGRFDPRRLREEHLLQRQQGFHLRHNGNPGNSFANKQ